MYCPNTTSPGLDCPTSYFSYKAAYVCTPCPRGYYCPNKNSGPIICPRGKYTNTPSEVCFDCTPGYICSVGSTSSQPELGICPKGYYCSDALTPTPCPSGTYGNKLGAISQIDGCSPCPVGYFCEAATVGYPGVSNKCPQGHFCIESTPSKYQYPCPGGTWSNKLGLQSQDGCLECKAGYYCNGGDSNGDNLCPGGHYCPQGTTFSTQYKCPDGTYTEEQGSTSNIFYAKLNIFHFMHNPSSK